MALADRKLITCIDEDGVNVDVALRFPDLTVTAAAGYSMSSLPSLGKSSLMEFRLCWILSQ
jgi:hypothetical protein